MDFQQEDNEKEAQAILLELLNRDGVVTVPTGDPADRILAGMEQSGLVKVIIRDDNLVTYELVNARQNKE